MIESTKGMFEGENITGYVLVVIFQVTIFRYIREIIITL